MDTFKILCNMEDTDLRPSPEFSAEYTLRTGVAPPHISDILRRDATAIALVEEKGGEWCFYDKIKVYHIPRAFENSYKIDVYYRLGLNYPERECINIDCEGAYRDAILIFLVDGNRTTLEARYDAITEGKAAFAKLNRPAHD